jgi:hypothetical protein
MLKEKSACHNYGIAILLIGIANWRIFTKAGLPGWYSLIPVYNIYAEYKICWKGWIGIASFLTLTTTITLATLEADLWIIAIPAIITMIIQTIFCFKLSKAYGKGIFTALLLIISDEIGRIVIGFGKSRYVGNM